VAAAGDVNGDGFGDVIVGAPGWGSSRGGVFADRGRALVFTGARGGPSNLPVWTVDGDRAYATLGSSVDGAGDVNGDGFADVIVGEYGFSAGGQPWRGRARVFPGSRSGPRTAQAWEFSGQAEEYLGEVVAGIGDVNGDGLGDVLIGGRVRTLVFHGRRGGLARLPSWVGPPNPLSVRGAGDVNGDGYDDVVFVGGPQTLLYMGSPAGLSREPAWAGRSALSAAGGGDVNGDGFGDLLLGPPDITSTTASLFLGSAEGLPLVAAWETPSSLQFSNFFGLSLSIAGDVNHDGFDDLLIATSTLVERDRPRGPAVILYLGGSGGPSRAIDWAGRVPGFGIERVVAMAGDVDGDAAADVLYGMPDLDGNAGRVSMFRLGAGYPVPAIAHEATQGVVTLGIPISLEARVSDITHSVSRVEIRYRLVEDVEPSAPIVMDQVSSGLYRGVIPAKFEGSGLVYSIRATDDYGLVGETVLVGIEFAYPGSAAAPFRVEVRPETPGRPGGIVFTLTRPGPARVRAFDARGRLVATLLDETSLSAGRHEAMFGGGGSRLPSGVYFYRVDTSDGSKTGRYLVFR
jgi:hypothetical protein